MTVESIKEHIAQLSSVERDDIMLYLAQINSNTPHIISEALATELQARSQSYRMNPDSARPYQEVMQ